MSVKDTTSAFTVTEGLSEKAKSTGYKLGFFLAALLSAFLLGQQSVQNIAGAETKAQTTVTTTAPAASPKG